MDISISTLLAVLFSSLLFISTSQADSQDILAYLQSLQGMEAEELTDPPEGYRYFLLNYEQPINHLRPWEGSFKQRMILLHRSSAAPTVLATNGYYSSVSTYRYNLTRILGANQLKVEHRYFAESRPEPLDWQHLTIRQAAADHHRIVAAIRPFYQGKWVSRGSSKGGMTALYHRRFYPNDVDGTVANVAPLSFGRLDHRYVTFQNRVGERSCRQALKRYQRHLLERRESMKALISDYAKEQNWQFSVPGGLDQVLDYTVAELYFQFYQYGSFDNCHDIPDAQATDEALFEFMKEWGPLSFMTDVGIKTFEPYFYQAISQFGYPKLLTRHLKDLLLYDPNDYRVYVSEWPEPFDWHAMWDVAQWVAFNSRHVMLIYGEIDPWTAAAFFLPDSTYRSTYKFMVANGNHGANITTLNSQDRKHADQMLKRWTGVNPIKIETLDEQNEGYDEDLYPYLTINGGFNKYIK
ncbi:peptidase [Endozoicomonas sp. SM1973]|uniref:Peptidase n=2 Tax=Spartinivicinus marinus TaxID=2994442 RepID=A0A853HUI1_9GAMM|nr:peptidase [Spartinivicinus marinus]